jgi:AcrR family transcriptional regulator
MAQQSTVSRILDTAEALFAEKGFAETSLRTITAKAEVNLAAVNYHFGSKKALIQAVFARFLTPFSRELSACMNDISDDKPLSIDELLVMLTEVTFKVSGGAKGRDRMSVFMRLLGLAYTQGQGHLRKYLQEEYSHEFRHFMQMINKATPDLSPVDRFWRIHFMLGAATFTLSSADSLKAIAGHDLGVEESLPDIIARLMPFLSAGLKA